MKSGRNEWPAGWGEQYVFLYVNSTQFTIQYKKRIKIGRITHQIVKKIFLNRRVQENQSVFNSNPFPGRVNGL